MSNEHILQHLKASSSREKRNYLHIYDEEYFSDINTETKAYWLGYIMADGCIKSSNKRSWSLQLSLAEEDGHMVQAFRDEIAPLKDVSIEEPGRHSKQRSIRIAIYSNRICYDLVKLNCVPKKSLILQFPPKNTIPSYLLRHFIRGYFDGDGGFMGGATLYAKIISSHDFCETLQKELSLNGIQTSIKKVNNNKNSVILCRKGEELCRFYRFIYDNANIYLKRKRDKFDQWIAEKTRLISNRVCNPSIRKSGERFVSRITLNGKWFYVGTFDTIQEAVEHAQLKWVSEVSKWPTFNEKLHQKMIAILDAKLIQFDWNF